MHIDILATESLGVRGLCCAVRTRQGRFLIDPGLALGFIREGLPPHPIQVAAGETAARRIVRHLAAATDVIFSHFHGDHVPLAEANPYQLPLAEVAPLLRRPRLWAKDTRGEPAGFAARERAIAAAAGQPLRRCQASRTGCLTFSDAMPHGNPQSGLGQVMMTRIEEDDQVFVHASDIQLLDNEPIEQIADWHPTILLVSGPPLYRHLHPAEVTAAANRVRRLARRLNCCLIDHHLLRSREGIRWLDDLHRETAGVVCCAADYAGQPRRLLEADRSRLYADHPVSENWHDRYQRRKLSLPAGTGDPGPAAEPLPMPPAGHKDQHTA